MAAAATAIATAQPIKRPVRKFSAKKLRMVCPALPASDDEIPLRTAQHSSQLRLLPDDDLGPDRNSIVEVDDVAIDQAEASGRNRASDGLRLIGAVNAIDRPTKIKRACTHGIAGASGHEAGQIGLALDHFRRRRPVRPFLLAGDAQQALPLKAVAANADAIADVASVGLHDIQKSLGRMNDDGAGSLGR